MLFSDPLREAIEQAYKSPGVGRGNYRLGAVVASRNNILSTGYNTYKSHPKYLRFYHRTIHTHAERAALIRCKNPENCDLYVVRILKDGRLAMSKPCKSCTRLIHTLGIRNVYFSDENGRISSLT